MLKLAHINSFLFLFSLLFVRLRTQMPTPFPSFHQSPQSLSQPDCNLTHFQFFSKYSLGKQDQLNRTFTQILHTIKLPPVSYNQSSFLSYTITNMAPSFYYIDSTQQSVILGRDTILVVGGCLQVDVDFAWSKDQFSMVTTGTGRAVVRSQEVMFEKKLTLETGYLDYELVQYYNVTFQFNDFSFIRIDPPNKLTDPDLLALKHLFNHQSPTTNSVKKVLALQIAEHFQSFLKANLKNEHYPLDDHFYYEWTNSYTQRTIQLPFSLRPTGVNLNQKGMSLTFVARILQDVNWRCGSLIPTQYLDTMIYGGLQEFISFSIFENSARYSLEKGYIDTNLNKNNWQSNMFEFFAGDLFEVIPSLTKKYPAASPLAGNCTYLIGSQTKIQKGSNYSVNTTTSHRCSLFAQNEKIIQFNITVHMETEIIPETTYLNFKVRRAEGVTDFMHIPEYEINNMQLGKQMVRKGLQRLKEEYVFGSKWKIYPRDYPHIFIQDGYVVIYDSTHVGSNVQKDIKYMK